MTRAYISLRECVELTQHLNGVDSDGYCNHCGCQENGKEFPYPWQPYYKLANLISSKLTSKEFRKLIVLLDCDCEEEFYNQISIIGKVRCPEIYSSDEDLEPLVEDLEEGRLDSIETEFERGKIK